MDETKKSRFYVNSMLLKLIICYFLMFCCYSKPTNSQVISVGGDNRWTDGSDYTSWAESFNFTIGDVLVFVYTKGKHNVYDVTKATYQSCNTSNGVNERYSSGNDRVELKEARQYWFICTVDSHCSLGMKFGINVTGSSTINKTSPFLDPKNTTFSQGNSASLTHSISSGLYYLLGLATWNLVQS